MGLKIRNCKVGGFFFLQTAFIWSHYSSIGSGTQGCSFICFSKKFSLFSPQGEAALVNRARNAMPCHAQPTQIFMLFWNFPNACQQKSFPFSCCSRWRCTSFPQLMLHLLQLCLSRGRTQPESNLPKSAAVGLGCPQLWSSMVFPLCQPSWKQLWSFPAVRRDKKKDLRKRSHRQSSSVPWE